MSEAMRTLDELLDPGAFDDYGPNGLQVPGGETVTKVVTGVSAQRELIDRAVALEAELVLVHHGLFWDFHPTGLTPILAERLRPLFRHTIGLAAYHLPLDAHPEVGNNALLAGLLGCESPRRFRRHRPPRGVRRRRGRRGRPVRARGGGHAARAARVRRRAGAGAEDRNRLRIRCKASPTRVELGLDAFLTGEPAEHVMADAREAGIHFIAAGHYATETFGVRRLGDLLADHFGIVHQFVDIPNPV